MFKYIFSKIKLIIDGWWEMLWNTMPINFQYLQAVRGRRGHDRMVQLHMQSVSITTDVVSWNLDQGEVHIIMWYRLSVTCDRSVVFSGSSGFIHQQNWPTWYSWNIIESGIKHHERNNQSLIVTYFLIVQMGFETEMRQVPEKYLKKWWMTWFGNLFGTINQIK